MKRFTLKKYSECLGILLFIVGGCTSTPMVSRTTNSIPSKPVVTSDETKQVCDALSALSGLCNSLYAEGTITFHDANASQSGQFTLRSKRPTAGGDSLSMIINGPFGITAAKFLGSTSEYNFYNAIEGEHYHGKPDEKELEKLTGMKGLSLGVLNDVVYGIPPIRLSGNDYENITRHVLGADRSKLIICRPENECTEAVTYKLTGGSVHILSYERWNRVIDSASFAATAPDLNIQFSGMIDDAKFLLPNFITAVSGSQTLEIEYSQAKENTQRLTVKIKMPQ
ncbi:MAG TPA: hypothetical protein VEW28_03415 [Candidatus Kapabacteria bacterium]|nr:hypothetical protein [Candidatus Kapabacteria bacterium]